MQPFGSPSLFGGILRVLIDGDPFLDLSKFWHERGRWPAKWVTHPKSLGQGAAVQAFRLRFSLSAAKKMRIHVSADERYELWLDGERMGRGPERGDRLNWFFETYDLELGAGEHVLAARTWWLNEFGPAPFAQISLRPGFLVAGEGDAGELLSTGTAKWECKLLSGCGFVKPEMAWGTGAKLHVIGSEFAWGWERGEGEGWEAVKEIGHAFGPGHLIDQPPLWVLKAGRLPAMRERRVNVGTARHVQKLEEMPKGEMVVRGSEHLAEEAKQWDAMLQRGTPLKIAARTIWRVIIDLGNYYTAYTDLVTSGGKGSSIRSWWAESLFEQVSHANAYGHGRVKGNRDQIEGKTFIGIGDTFEPDGGTGREFNTLWWEAGRYIELIVSTREEPLVIERFSLRETHYPIEWRSKFESSDGRLEQVIPMAKRVLEMCSHETYMDCPYYEQLMYVGDTRLEVLTTYSWTIDDRLPRKALRIYDESRKSPGFTQSRYPSRVQQTIPPFSLWWIGMLHDYMMWRGDRAFVADLMPGVRSVLDAFGKWKTEEGLVRGPAGWNFIDWVNGWQHGMPVDGNFGISAALNLKLAWISKQAAELEEFAGEPEMAARWRREAAEVGEACGAFWDESRGMYADDLAKKHFSEHAQCLALLGEIDGPEKRQKIIEGLLGADDLARTTVYFMHYLFEVFGKIGRIDRLIERMGLWFDLTKMGLKTVIEQPEPSRSDCHAWGAHPIYHYLATVLGIRPAKAGFEEVSIRPQLGPLEWAKGSMAHPCGSIDVEVSRRDGGMSGRVRLPEGVRGTLYLKDQSIRLNEGATVF